MLVQMFCRVATVAMTIALTALATRAAAAPPQPIRFEQTTVLYAGGEAAGPGVRSRVWHAGRRVRLEAADQTGGPALLLWMDVGRAFRLDPEQKVAVEIDMDRLRARAHSDAAVASGLMGGGAGESLRAAPLPGRRTVAGHACRGYRLTGPSVAMEVWVASDLGVGIDAFADFLEWSGAAQTLGGLIEELRKLPGFPLETTSRVSVLGQTHETVSRVTSVEVGPLPARLFELPAGWRVVRDMPPPAEVPR